MYYEFCKDWIDNVGIENNYFEKNTKGSFKTKEQITKKTEIDNNREEIKEQLTLYKMFKK